MTKQKPPNIFLFRPRVRAQRKFAQGQGQSPHLGGVIVKPSSKSGVGSASSGSSTASGPSSSNPSKSDGPAKTECPKTEDFLTFLCLRGSFYHAVIVESKTLLGHLLYLLFSLISLPSSHSVDPILGIHMS